MSREPREIAERRARAEKALRTPDLEWARDLVHGLAEDVLALLSHLGEDPTPERIMAAHSAMPESAMRHGDSHTVYKQGHDERCYICTLNSGLLATLDERDALVKRAELAEQLEASCRAQMFQFKGERDALRDEVDRVLAWCDDHDNHRFKSHLFGGDGLQHSDTCPACAVLRLVQGSWIARAEGAVGAFLDTASEPQGSRPKTRSPMRPFPGDSVPGKPGVER
jgi:hypothetical protein